MTTNANLPYFDLPTRTIIEHSGYEALLYTVLAELKDLLEAGERGAVHDDQDRGQDDEGPGPPSVP